MNYTALHKEEENKKKGFIISLMVHAMLLLIALIPILLVQENPREIAGIIIALGTPDGGSDSSNPMSDSEELTDEITPETEDSSPESKSEEATSPQKEKVEQKPKTQEKPQDDITPLAETSDLAVKEAQKEKARRDAEQAKQAEEDQAKKAAEKLAREEAAKKAAEEAEKEKYAQSKQQYSDLFGAGKGNNDNTGNQGAPTGDPNSDALDDLAQGSGRIGGGLSNRSVLFEPTIDDNSQREGKVVVKVCVDSTGKVVESKFTQRGSTTTDKYLVDLAVKAAKKYTFSPSDVETQCGTITIDFKLI